MKHFYIKHMTLAHNESRWEDRANYAQMAGIDFVRWFYIEPVTPHY